MTSVRSLHLAAFISILAGLAGCDHGSSAPADGTGQLTVDGAPLTLSIATVKHKVTPQVWTIDASNVDGTMLVDDFTINLAFNQSPTDLMAGTYSCSSSPAVQVSFRHDGQVYLAGDVFGGSCDVTVSNVPAVGDFMTVSFNASVIGGPTRQVSGTISASRVADGP